MELLEQVAKYGFIFGASAAIIAALIGWYSYRTLVRKAAQTFLFMKYTERYEQIMASYPENAVGARLDLSGEPPEASIPLTLAVLKYLNLCSEEFYLWKSGLVEDAVWKIWEEELKRTISSPLYRREWQMLRKEFESYPDFLTYVNRIQSEPGLVRTAEAAKTSSPPS